MSLINDDNYENIDIISSVIKKIRNAKSDDEAREILLDNIILLNSTDEVSIILHQNLIEGPNCANLDDDPRFIESFEKYDESKVLPSTKAQEISKRFIEKLNNGDFDEEFERRRQAEIGYGEPMDLSEKGIKKEVEKFGKTLELLEEIMPDEFGTLNCHDNGISRTRKNDNK